MHRQINIKVKMTKIVFLDQWHHYLQPFAIHNQKKNCATYV